MRLHKKNYTSEFQTSTNLNESINIVNDVFQDDPTTNWPGESMEEE